MKYGWTRSRTLGLAVAGAVAIISIHSSAQAPATGQGRGGGQGQGGGRGAAAARQTSGLEVLPVQGFDRTRVYMIAGGGANVIVQVGDDGVLMVDTGNAESADKVFATVRQITDKPIRWIINTHAHLENVGGNEGVIKLAGGQRTSQGGGGGGVENANGPLVVAHQEAVNMMMDAKPEYPDDAVPKDTFLTDNKQIYFNGEGIEVWEMPHAHSAGDLMVFFRKSDVIAVGDLVSTNTYPMFDVEAGGTLQGLLNAMNRIVPMMIPRFNQMDGTRVLPSHGRISDQSDVAEFRDTATIIRDRILYMIDKGMSLEQVKAAKPTLDYDPVYGASNGPWSTDKFIEAVYTELKNNKGPKPALGLNFVDGGK
jgi:glyoxylase-like metal-dependent hydrolase (beta-lactamase superfamily II)